MNDQHRKAIRLALQILNALGREAAEFFAAELEKPGNEDAEAWIAAYFEPVSTTETVH